MTDASDQGPPESPQQRPAGPGGPPAAGGKDHGSPAGEGKDHGSPAADGRDHGPPATGGKDHGSPAAAETGPGGEPGTLLADLARLRRQARAARHAYWFPLILFGLLTCGAAPLYVAAAAPPAPSGAYAAHLGPILLGGSPAGGNGRYIGWYWAAALAGGYLLTVIWYRRQDRKSTRLNSSH